MNSFLASWVLGVRDEDAPLSGFEGFSFSFLFASSGFQSGLREHGD